MAFEPFFNGQIIYDEGSAALNLGILYRSFSSVINVAGIGGSIFFTFDPRAAKELIHIAYALTTSGPGVVTLYGPSETLDITDLGNAIPTRNQRADITKASPILLFENSVVANVGTNLVHAFQIGVLGSNAGQSEGGAITGQKGILGNNGPALLEFKADFADTDCRWYTSFFEKDPKYNVGIE